LHGGYDVILLTKEIESVSAENILFAALDLISYKDTLFDLGCAVLRRWTELYKVNPLFISGSPIHRYLTTIILTDAG
jgi:hypothetical protein